MTVLLVLAVVTCCVWLLAQLGRALRGRSPEASIEGFHRALDALAPRTREAPSAPSEDEEVTSGSVPEQRDAAPERLAER
ncbi:hypothetical protein ER308_04620 [Egibacter rhizosphaerae]|uniref:Uncharacterized protein n=1 Tax=Egibacter rhizosphaerae TaxID=1670831 RepID=A0A411YCG8_9ACTN|nr:hypothetical protein [Egibacter rhizosphaerae]QBI18899.1 hypothetical protein ER308_04620 [Egibacter rhizosphaerae]